MQQEFERLFQQGIPHDNIAPRLSVHLVGNKIIFY